MAIGQNGFLYNTIQHSHTSDAERMEIRFRQDRKCHINSKKYITQHIGGTCFQKYKINIMCKINKK